MVTVKCKINHFLAFEEKLDYDFVFLLQNRPNYFLIIFWFYFLIGKFEEELNLKLTGPFDFLKGTIKKETKLSKVKLNLHGRYFFDSPEVSTVLASTQEDDDFHIGYFRYDSYFHIFFSDKFIEFFLYIPWFDNSQKLFTIADLYFILIFFVFFFFNLLLFFPNSKIWIRRYFFYFLEL